MQIEFSGVYGALLQEYNVARLRELNRERSARIAALKTREDAEKYVAEVRAKIAASFALPERPAKLAVTHCGTVETPECRIEKIIFESRKDFPVTAHCFLPREFSGKLPGVLFLCGHAGEGKLSAAYQTAAATLAANGCVVLLVDPISQGERWQFLNVPDAAGVNGLCTNEHNMLGKQLWLCDEFFGTWRAHDALCGLDYLLSRPEVDTTRVGVTGNSGGGTMTTFVQALDPRFTMAAPSCYVTSWLRNIENELPADVEQIPPGILASGCEMGDFVLAYAPRPVLLLGQKNDFFDPRGLTETYEECRKVYALLGAEENLRLFIGPTNHGYSVENRCSMYKFFSEHADLAAIRDEVSLAGVPAEKLWCTATGQAADMPDKKQVHDLIVEMLDGFAAERSALDLPALKKLLEEKYGYPSSAAVPYCRSLRPWGYRSGTPRQMMFSRFGIESEPGMIVPLLMRDSKSRAFQYIPAMEEVTLYIPHLSAAEELVEMASDGTVIGVDVRGIGAARSYNCDYFCMNNFFHPYGQDYHYNACSIMFGSSILADRLRDLFSTIAYIKSCGVKKIHLAGRGQGAVPALFAAVLSDDIASLKLYDAPVSFDAMARTRVTLWPHAVMPRGILKYTDLPDMYKALEAAGKLEIINFADQLFRASRV